MMSKYELPDAKGYFGQFGGVFVAETLIEPLRELRDAYDAARQESGFIAEFEEELKLFVGRPSPIYPARRWSQKMGGDRKSTRLNSSHPSISYAVFCFKKTTTFSFVGKPHSWRSATCSSIIPPATC